MGLNGSWALPRAAHALAASGWSPPAGSQVRVQVLGVALAEARTSTVSRSAGERVGWTVVVAEVVSRGASAACSEPQAVSDRSVASAGVVKRSVRYRMRDSTWEGSARFH